MGKKILIVGGVAAGTKAAARARRLNPALDITLITEENYISYGACGLPYYIGGVIKEKKSLFSYTVEKFAVENNVRILTRHRAIYLDPKNKQVVAQKLDTGAEVKFDYDSLLIATGARPIKPPLPGIGLKNIYTLRTPDDADAILETLRHPDTRTAVIVGGGLIALEMAENLLLHNLQITVVELLNQIVPPLDEDFAWLVERHLIEKGIRISKSDGVKAFSAKDGERVGAVITEHNRFPADLVILSIGVKPHVEFAVTGGVQLGKTGAIKVDATMRTNFAEIFAAGDCVESQHLVTAQPVFMPLGSVANRQGRVAGTNLAGGKAEFGGVVGSIIVKVFDLTVAKTGLNEKEAKRNGIPYVRTILQYSDRAGYYPGREKIWLKILAHRENHRLLGAQIVGKAGVDKRIDVMATAIGAGLKIEHLIDLDLSYAPPYSPAVDSLNIAGQVLENLLSHKLEMLSSMEVQALRTTQPEKITLVDIRQPVEKTRTGTIPGAVHIPLTELKERASKELSPDKQIILFGTDGNQALKGCQVLQQQGFSRCAGLDGGIALWPYDLL